MNIKQLHIKRKAYLWLIAGSSLLQPQLVAANGRATGGYLEAGQVNTVPLADCLRELAAKAQKRLVYDSRLLEGKRITPPAAEMPAEQALMETLSRAGIAYQLKGSMVILRAETGAEASATARQTVIHGTVTDSLTGEPIAGATVRTDGSMAAVKTGNGGSFSLPWPGTASAATLTVSSVGYRTYSARVTLGTADGLAIALQQDLFGLDEVVVTGQGLDISKRRLSTNVTSISGAELEKVPAGRIDQLLQAKLPNAQIRLTGGQSGATSIIRARGVVSAFMNSTPVIYVDGVRMDNLNTASTIGGGSTQGAGVSSIADIPMDNIERIEYINGGAATTLYGSDAANGVIQIFTKKGGADRTSVTAEATVGREAATTDFLHFERTKDLLFEPGTYQKYNVAINGASGRIGYSFTGGYLNSTGVQLFKQNANKRLDLRSGFRADLHEKLVYESSFSFVNNQYKRNRNGNQGGYTGLWFAESGASAVTGPQPRFNPRIDELSEEEFARMREYVREAERLQDNEIVVNRFQTSQSFQYKPLENLQLKALGGLDFRVLRNQNIQTNEYLTHTTGNLTTDRGSISNGERKYWGLTLELNGQHRAEVGDFSFVTTVGGQLFRNEDRQVAYNGTNIRDGARNIADAATKTSNEVYYEVVNYGVYVQSNIGWKNRLFMDLGLRGDGNSAFGEAIGVQYYPKVGLSYIPSATEWWADALPFIASAKVRGNYGVAGNFPTPFMNLRTVSFPGYLGEQAASFGTPGVDLRPEKTKTLEAGVDLGFWRDRVRLSAGMYHTITDDALFSVPSAPSTGEAEAFRNVGKILNRGWEFSTNIAAIQKASTSLNVNLAVNTLYNRVLDAGGAAPFNINGFSERTIQTVVQEGYPIGFIRASYGVFGPDGVLESTTPLQYLGTTIPDLFGSMGIDFRYKGLNIYVNADYQQGAYANNWDSQFRYNYGAGDEGIPQGEINSPRGRAGWLEFTNMFIEKTDFIKVRSIGATYSFTAAELRNRLQGVTVGISAINPLNFASSSFDPEATISGSAAGQGGATTGGIAYATYSAPRQFLLSVRITL